MTIEAAPALKRVHDSLTRAVRKHRIILWYDATGEWAETFDAFPDDGVALLRVTNNEFATKVRVVADPDPEARFLVYVPGCRPPDSENWLLDLLLQGHEFRADKASLILEDVGLSYEYEDLIKDHSPFFNSEKRVRAVKELLVKDDDRREIRTKMMAVLAGTDPNIDSILLKLLDRDPGGGQLEIDPVEEKFGAARLVEPFWDEIQRLFGYHSASPTLRDFVVELFRGANPLDTSVRLHPHAKVFLHDWQDSQKHRDSFRAWSRELEGTLRIAATLDALGEKAALGNADVFEAFEKFTVHLLCGRFAREAPAAELRATIQERRASSWWPEHEHAYAALGNAIDLRELLASAELTMDSAAEGLNRYASSWWRIDMAYRRCAYHLRRYGHTQVMGQVSEWVEKIYVNNFLLPLADRWGDRIAALESWTVDGPVPQRDFFEAYVQPFRRKGQKIFVIVSDALRYEAAAEFAERLSSANRWSAELDAVGGCLPSYTQLGMASLLPGAERFVDADSANVIVDGQAAAGTRNRAEILRRACGPTATALQAEEFLELNTRTEGRALTRDHDVIYIFHNRIDTVGDDRVSEGRTFEAVEDAFTDLDAIVRKVASINGNNMLLTADHGFLFQQEPVQADDMVALPPAEEWTYRNRRFALGRGVSASHGVKLFSAEELGVSGDWTAAFPLSLGRFPQQGSGKRYVHGGISLQEVVVPVVRIHKARSDDMRQVEVELLRVPSRITTGQLSIALFQVRPIGDNTLPRILRVAVFAEDGSEISDSRTVTFDSKDQEARNRETPVLLTMSHAADAYNDRNVEIRLEETIPRTTQTVIYKSQSVKLQKPFASDFDEY